MSVLFSVPPRANGFREKSRSPNGMPVFNSSAHEKRPRHPLPWAVPVFLPIPGVRGRSLRVFVPNLPIVHHLTVSYFGRRRGNLVLLILCFTLVFSVFALAQRFGTSEKQWSTPLFPGDPSTLVYAREDLQKIWKWEIESGHYPSSRELPKPIRLVSPPLNPALPPRKVAKIPSRFRPPGASVTYTIGHGAKRVYLDNQARPPNVAYPPRPVPGSVADLDVIMDLCDFSTEKYVRDCLEVLRLGGGLDSGSRLRRGKFDEWRYIYKEDGEVQKAVAPVVTTQLAFDGLTQASASPDPNAGLSRKPRADWELPIQLPAPLEHRPYHSLPSTCDPENPRLFHMFWTGPFTDKPYLALLSFLFTQNTRLNLHEENPDTTVCRPQFWLWINPGPAAAVPNPSATHDMFEQLKANPWASPFLHPRFKGVISFKMWNTTEQLDGVPEIKDDWRVLRDNLFNSGGHIVSVPQQDESSEAEASTSAESATASSEGESASKSQLKSDGDDMLKFVGSKSADSYDRLSVILSDLARFVLCHRFGGVYLDADTIFLRDWEELWGWKGAFAYRWSRLEKYNTAVLRMNKGSALGTFLFRTALKNGLDFHPMTVSRYTKDAHLEGLLLRLPDALFDSAWLNTENYQRDRPPQPYFPEFIEFFDTSAQNSAAPAALGFEGFFRGAYSYHFHNFWWKPFDPSRNWPDLGERFIEGERVARTNLNIAANVTEPAQVPLEEHVSDDKRDLDWATVLKRTFESYIRGERPNMYGEWLSW
ncbi:glycosyltransferase family 32 protein [Artomyces pyxidatus]|uniref:Glycosyltransferase family 32 protein n=1 Tax=Artomyces pyxidatus TaxID=48021 RepID=A0ACB8TH59_9AGAM|nr:glycosyltransferase family 32 protein [Artomyces pyxidatus]